jgi:capping protein alpha
VEKSIRVLVDSELVDRTLPQIAKRYNEEQLLVATVPDTDTKFLISKAGAVSENEYLDPSTNSVVVFDHIKKAPTSRREASETETTKQSAVPYRAMTNGLLEEYVTNFYPSAVGVTYATVDDSGVITVTALISATKAQLSSKWSGRIRSEYSASFKPGDASTSIEGGVSIKVHYFEEGNVQLNTSAKTSVTVSATSPDEFAKSFVGAIEAFEHNFHKNLETEFSDLSENTFKQMRRKLPLNQSKFDFENWAQYEIGSELSKQ